ncbi:hypothetical protein C1M59_21750 [Vibrio diazotrophicus]|nr:hypothetical protein C1M59_21750 [Vibrio diazotrophicus]
MQKGFIERQERIADEQQKTVPAKAQELIESMLTDGSWEGIDYSYRGTSSWSPRIHLDNMRMIAAAYVQTGELEYADSAIQAMEYWFQVNPTSENWWWGDIGKPQFLGEVALMLGDQLPWNLRFEAAKIMPTVPGIKPSDQTEQTGGNRSDINLGVIYGALLTQNDALISAAIKDMENTVAYKLGEGVQADNSFHSHGAQLYSAGYGEVWFNATVRMAYTVRGSQWQFSKEKTDMLAAFFLDGWRWMKRGANLDYNTWGRSISRTKPELIPLADLQPSQPSDNITYMDMVAALTPERAAEAMAFKKHVADARLGVPSGLNGFKHFWRSDYSTKMADGHFFGIRMNSQRTEPNESGNGENLLGYWLGYGSTFLEQRGDEYHNIFPVWDWRLVPGVTAPEYQAPATPWGAVMQPEVSFVGGVSNGLYGVTTMDMNLDTKPSGGNVFNTQAKKTWFSFRDEIVALGSGISSTSDANVNTSVNQTLLNGKVTVDGVEVENGAREISSANWVHHDGVGYIFPENGQRHLSNQTRTGNWKQVRDGSSADEVSKDVFTLHISHGVNPSNADYQYIIVPEQTAEQTESYQQNLPVVVLQNSTSVQAVRHSDLKITGIVFHYPSSVVISDDLTVSVNKPSVLLVDESGIEPVVTLSTPGFSYSAVELTLDSKARGEAVTQVVMTHGKESQLGNSVTFPFYQGAEKSNQAFRDEIIQAEEEAKAAEKAAVEAEAAAQGLSVAEAKEIAEAREKMKTALAAGGAELIVPSDGHVRNGSSADKNYGTSGYMGAENHADNPALEYRAVLNFDVTGLAGVNASSAKLKLFLKKVDDRDDAVKDKPIHLQAFAFDAPTDWTENTMTWNKLPDITGATSSNILTLTESQSDEWVELDVTDIVNKMGNKRNLNLVLVNIDEKGKGGFIHLSPRETGAEHTARLVIQGELKELLKEDLALTATQDLDVKSGGSVNNGYSGVSGNTKDLIRFDVTRLNNKSVASAKLKLYALNIDSKGVDKEVPQLQAFAVNAGDWDEKSTSLTINDLSYTNGALGSEIITINRPTAESVTWGVQDWIELDVTDIVNGLEKDAKALDIAVGLVAGTQSYVGLRAVKTDKEPQLILQAANTN